MNTKQFLVLFASVAILNIADCTFDPIVVQGLAAYLPLVSASAGALSLPLAVLGVLKLAAALKLSGISLASLKGGQSEPEYAEPSGYGRQYSRSRPHRFARYRNKRSADESSEAIFSLVSSMDMYSCGKALVCALEAKEEQSLTQDEQIIMALFADRKGKSYVDPASAKAEYELAAELGLATKDEVACRKRYSVCPYTADEMMGALRNSQL
jgi:hypothetical protein